MSLNMYLGEVQAQTESMNSFCTTTIQGMEQIIHSIDAFALILFYKDKHIAVQKHISTNLSSVSTRNHLLMRRINPSK